MHREAGEATEAMHGEAGEATEAMHREAGEVAEAMHGEAPEANMVEEASGRLDHKRCCGGLGGRGGGDD